MAEADVPYAYVAIDGLGRRVTGKLVAREYSLAFEQLKRDGLSPIKITRAKAISKRATSGTLRDRDVAELLSSLARLLNAGADILTALQILGSKATRPEIGALCRALALEVGGGGALDRALERALGAKHAFIPALISSGEAAGDTAGGFRRAAEMLEERLKLRDQFVSVLSYPAFVLISSIGALFAILFFVVPSLASVVTDSGAPPPLTLAILIAASNFLRSNIVALLGGAAFSCIAFVLALRLGLLKQPIDRLLMEGPFRGTVCALAYGAFSISLGSMLAAGAPMSEALKLATRSVQTKPAREALDVVSRSVVQGQSLSIALERVKGFPASISRLASVGEVSGDLGEMLARAGKLEEDAAIRRIETSAKILGPTLIILLGGLIGLLMMGLLSGVSQLGQAALQ